MTKEQHKKASELLKEIEEVDSDIQKIVKAMGYSQDYTKRTPIIEICGFNSINARITFAEFIPDGMFIDFLSKLEHKLIIKSNELQKTFDEL